MLGELRSKVEGLVPSFFVAWDAWSGKQQAFHVEGFDICASPQWLSELLNFNSKWEAPVHMAATIVQQVQEILQEFHSEFMKANGWMVAVHGIAGHFALHRCQDDAYQQNWNHPVEGTLYIQMDAQEP